MRDELLLRPKWLREWPGHFSLIEPSIGSTPGVPDVHLADNGFAPAWVEFKAINEDGKVKMRPAQRDWARTYLRVSPRVALVALDELGYWTLPMSFVLTISPGKLDPSTIPSPSPYTRWGDITPRLIKKQLELCFA